MTDQFSESFAGIVCAKSRREHAETHDSLRTAESGHVILYFEVSGLSSSCFELGQDLVFTNCSDLFVVLKPGNSAGYIYPGRIEYSQ